MAVKVLILEIIAVEDITVVITMEITAEVETVVVEEILDAVAVATEAAEEEILEVGGVAHEEDDGEEEEKEDDTGTDEYQSCGDEVEAGASCEGEWKATLCVDEDGTFWWCEGGVWTSDKDR